MAESDSSRDSSAGMRDDRAGRQDPLSEMATAMAAMTSQFSAAAVGATAGATAGATMQPVAQLEAMARDVAARHEQVRALVAQLTAFDEQLAAFERTLGPMLEWSRGWTRLVAAADPLGFTRPPAAAKDDPRRSPG